MKTSNIFHLNLICIKPHISNKIMKNTNIKQYISYHLLDSHNIISNLFITFQIYMFLFYFIFSMCQVYTLTWPPEFTKCIPPLINRQVDTNLSLL
jgi:hypothetical protein